MSSTKVIDRLTRRLFGKRLIQNNLRGELVEEIVAMATEPEWQLCGADWGACDLIRKSGGLRMQVKQSAALQTWSFAAGPPANPIYSIARKTGRYEGSTWIEEPGRNADIFVFAWHGRTDEAADHRAPEQWQFLVVAERDLPDQKSISLKALRRMTDLVEMSCLRDKVAEVAKRVAVTE
jgi:hypothetical protein